MLLPLTDISSQGIWSQLKDLEGLELKELAEKLPEMILSSRAGSTVKKCLGAFRTWKAWALEKRMTVIPVKDHHWVLYLQFLADNSQCYTAITHMYSCSVTMVHVSVTPHFNYIASYIIFLIQCTNYVTHSELVTGVPDDSFAGV